jgi:hypothetical protein
MIFDLSPFEYFSTHIQLIGWPAICYGIWKVTQFVTELKGRATTAEEHITKMATNCFPTMQASLKNQDGLLHSMDESLKTIAGNTPKRRR